MRCALPLIFLALPAFADCLFRALVPRAQPNETAEDYLARFDPKTLSFQSGGTKKLSGSNYRITLADGRQYTVRIAAGETEARFETFAAAFVRSVPGLEATPVRRFEGEEAKNIANAVRATDPYFDAVVKGMMAKPGFNLTIAPFYPDMKSGEDLFREHDIWLPDDITLAKAKEILPPKVMEQVADHWALNTVLGIADFHSGNWLVKDERVLGLDYGWYGAEFREGKPTLDFGVQSRPFSVGGTLTPAERNFLQSRLSPSMRDFLRSLSRPQLRALAEKQGFPATDAQLDGMVERARLILAGG